MTALAEAPTAASNLQLGSNAASKSLEIAAPPTLVDVRGLWTAIHGSRVVSQENRTLVDLCPGDEVRTALQNFRVVDVLYGSVAEAPQVACTFHAESTVLCLPLTDRHQPTNCKFVLGGRKYRCLILFECRVLACSLACLKSWAKQTLPVPPPHTQQPKTKQHQKGGPVQLLRVLLNESVSAPSQTDLRMWKFVPLNDSLDLLSESMHDSSR